MPWTIKIVRDNKQLMLIQAANIKNARRKAKDRL